MVGQKFAVVEFFERNEVEIMETRHFITRMSPSTFNADQWDRNTQIHVKWPVNKVPGKAQVKHVARILRFGDDQKSLVPFLKAAERGDDVPFSGRLEYGRGKRVPEPKKAWTSESEESSPDEDHSNRQQKKRRRQCHREAEEAYRKELQERLRKEGMQEEDEQTELTTLRREVQKLREENAALRNSFRIIKGLPELLGKIQHLTHSMEPPLQTTSTAPSHDTFSQQPITIPPTPTTSDRQPPSILSDLHSPHTPKQHASTLHQPATSSHQPVTPSHRPVTPSNQPVTPSHRPVLTHSQTVPRPHANMQKVFGYSVDPDGKVDLGYGVSVNAANLQYVSKSDVKKTTYTVCETLFTRDELASSSVTGRQSNAFKGIGEKPMLDGNKVSAVIDFVKKVHPGSDNKNIKKMIGAKLNICQKLKKRKELPPGSLQEAP